MASLPSAGCCVDSPPRAEMNYGLCLLGVHHLAVKAMCAPGYLFRCVCFSQVWKERSRSLKELRLKFTQILLWRGPFCEVLRNRIWIGSPRSPEDTRRLSYILASEKQFLSSVWHEVLGFLWLQPKHMSVFTLSHQVYPREDAFGVWLDKDGTCMYILPSLGQIHHSR